MISDRGRSGCEFYLVAARGSPLFPLFHFETGLVVALIRFAIGLETPKREDVGNEAGPCSLGLSLLGAETPTTSGCGSTAFAKFRWTRGMQG